MTKKHYEAIAKIIASAYNHALLYPGDSTVSPASTVITTAGRLADYFEKDNPKFQRERFLEACGIRSQP